MFKTLLFIVFFNFITACSGFNGEWPKLTDPVAGPPERSQLEGLPAQNTEIIKPLDSKPIKIDEALKLSNELMTALKAQWHQYQEAKTELSLAKDAEDKRIAWHGAQLSLSRVSAEIDLFRNLAHQPMSDDTMEASTLTQKLKEQLEEEEKKMEAARLFLIQNKP